MTILKPVEVKAQAVDVSDDIKSIASMIEARDEYLNNPSIETAMEYTLAYLASLPSS
jgi:hypothetical protein